MKNFLKLFYRFIKVRFFYKNKNLSFQNFKNNESKSCRKVLFVKFNNLDNLENKSFNNKYECKIIKFENKDKFKKITCKNKTIMNDSDKF